MSTANGMQDLIVFACVALAAVYALLRLLPKPALRLKTLVAQGLERLGSPAMAIRLREQAQSAAACGSGCGSCGSCDTTPKSKPVSHPAVEKTVQFHRPR